jgi:hypothetical protein
MANQKRTDDWDPTKIPYPMVGQLLADKWWNICRVLRFNKTAMRITVEILPRTNMNRKKKISNWKRPYPEIYVPNRAAQQKLPLKGGEL